MESSENDTDHANVFDVKNNLSSKALNVIVTTFKSMRFCYVCEEITEHHISHFKSHGFHI